MEFTFYNSYVILELVPSTLIFWTDLNCWRKSYSNKLRCSCVEVIATKMLRSSSQSGWPLRNIHISNDNGSFTLYGDVFFPLLLPRLLQELTVWSVLLIFLVVCWCYYVFLRSEFCGVLYDFSIQMIFGSSLPPVVCMRVHVLFTLFVFVCV